MRFSTIAITAAAAVSPCSAAVKYIGTNIAGFDFGCTTDGTCNLANIDNVASLGQSQMQHFVQQTGFNAFRLPVGWQFLVANNLGGTLNAANLAQYDQLVQACLNAGAALCIIDIHNYARYNGQIIGQSNGAVTNAQFASLWSQLAAKYKGNTKIAFGIMNEPHDLPSVPLWGQTVQAAVTAIRTAGATDTLLLLPGTDYSSASTLLTDGGYAAMAAVVNLDGSKTNLAQDVHQYLDSDGSGGHANCVTNKVDAFTALATQLRIDGRQAILTETGGGPNDASCLTDVCQELSYLAANSDVFLGWTGWAAGGFATSYVTSMTPSGSPGNYVDQPLVTQCFVGANK